LSNDLSVLNGPYLNDILNQPQAIHDTWNGLRTSPAMERVAELIHHRKFERLLLTGMGSSFYGLHPLALEAAEHGWTPLMLETSELVHHYPRLLNESTLVIAVSQSGQSAETVRLLQQERKGHAIIGVTNTPESPLAAEADVCVLTHAGHEYSVSCKTYVSTLVALSLLASALSGGDYNSRLGELENVWIAVDGYLRDWNSNVSQLCDELSGIRDIFLVGRGASLAAAGTGALIIKESDHFHAEGMSSAALRHGPFDMLNDTVFVGVFAGEEPTRALNENMAAELRTYGARCAIVSANADNAACRVPEVPATARPIVEILPAQMMTLALAALAGREPGRFDRATKITAVE